MSTYHKHFISSLCIAHICILMNISIDFLCNRCDMRGKLKKHEIIYIYIYIFVVAHLSFCALRDQRTETLMYKLNIKPINVTGRAHTDAPPPQFNVMFYTFN